jgi:hypothetical protein
LEDQTETQTGERERETKQTRTKQAQKLDSKYFGPGDEKEHQKEAGGEGQGPPSTPLEGPHAHYIISIIIILIIIVVVGIRLTVST